MPNYEKEKPVFELMGIDSDEHIKIFLDGKVEGLDTESFIVFNRVPRIVDKLLGRLRKL